MLPVVMSSEVRDQVRHRATVVRRGEVRGRRRRETAWTTQLQFWHFIHLESVHAQTQTFLFTQRQCRENEVDFSPQVDSSD